MIYSTVPLYRVQEPVLQLDKNAGRAAKIDVARAHCSSRHEFLSCCCCRVELTASSIRSYHRTAPSRLCTTWGRIRRGEKTVKSFLLATYLSVVFLKVAIVGRRRKLKKKEESKTTSCLQPQVKSSGGGANRGTVSKVSIALSVHPHLG